MGKPKLSAFIGHESWLIFDMLDLTGLQVPTFNFLVLNDLGFFKKSVIFIFNIFRIGSLLPPPFGLASLTCNTD